MRTNRISIVLATVLAMLSLTVAAQAQRDPGQVARRCIQTINAQTERGVAAMGQTCERTVDGIRAALRQGDREGARRIAHAGMARVNRLAAGTTAANNETTRNCVQMLRRMGADRQLIRAVLDANAGAARTVAAAQERCAHAIRGAFGRN